MKYFILFWTFAILIVPVAIILAVFEFWWPALVVFLLAVFCRNNSVRTIIRAGAAGVAPRLGSSADILRLFKGQRPTIVGSAWGFFLQTRTAESPVLSLRNFTGQGKGDKRGWWRAGTTIREVIDFYVKQGKTFASHPSITEITIGAWFATGSHGNGGNAGKPSTSVLEAVEIVCFDPPSVQIIDNYKEIRAIFDSPNVNHVITYVKFHNLEENRMLQKRAFSVDSVQSANKWLSSGAILRVLFVGAAREGLGIRWEKPYEKTEHIDPHCCSKCSTFIQADVCSPICGCRENYTHWNGLTTLYNANIWAPSVIPLETFIAVIGGVTNFELVFRVKEMNGVVLEKMVRLLRDMHKDIGGRTEIRYGTGVVFWDLSLTKSFGKPFNLLAENFGVKRLALHPGKYQPRNIKTTMKIVKIGVIYFNLELEKIKF